MLDLGDLMIVSDLQSLLDFEVSWGFYAVLMPILNALRFYIIVWTVYVGRFLCVWQVVFGSRRFGV